jgi:hypothetical protein
VECSPSLQLEEIVTLTSPGRLVRLLSGIVRFVDVCQATRSERVALAKKVHCPTLTHLLTFGVTLRDLSDLLSVGRVNDRNGLA